MSWCLFVSSAISTIGNKEMLITIGIYTIGFVQEVPLHGKKTNKTAMSLLYTNRAFWCMCMVCKIFFYFCTRLGKQNMSYVVVCYIADVQLKAWLSQWHLQKSFLNLNKAWHCIPAYRICLTISLRLRFYFVHASCRWITARIFRVSMDWADPFDNRCSL